MKAIIKIFGVKEPLITRETYGTIKRRLWTGGNFVEVSDIDSKCILNKDAIEIVGMEEAQKIEPLTKKRVKKV